MGPRSRLRAAAERAATGFDAAHTYRLHLPRAGLLRLELEVYGGGRAAAGSDLDLELRSRRSRLLAATRAEEPTERIEQRVTPRWYVVSVRDGGTGNRASYRVTAPLPFGAVAVPGR